MTTELPTPPRRALPFDPSNYHLGRARAGDPASLEFYQKATGIRDEDELREHILRVSRHAYETEYPYPCIYMFNFLDLRMDRSGSYSLALAQANPSSPRFRKDRIFLDVGTCFGVDVRKLVMDGWEGERVFAVELRQGLVDTGYALCRDSPSSCPITFIIGDIFSDSFLPPLSSSNAASMSQPLPPISSASPPKDLSLLRGKVTALYAGSLFHLFDQAAQLDLARRLGSLASLDASADKPSVIFGQQIGASDPGLLDDKLGRKMFCHTARTFVRLWEEDVFGPGGSIVTADDAPHRRVKVRASAQEFKLPAREWQKAFTSGDEVWLKWTVEVWSE